MAFALAFLPFPRSYTPFSLGHRHPDGDTARSDDPTAGSGQHLYMPSRKSQEESSSRTTGWTTGGSCRIGKGRASDQPTVAANMDVVTARLVGRLSAVSPGEVRVADGGLT